MDTKEFNDALEALKVKLEGKTAEEVKTAMDAFKVEQQKAFESLSTKEEVEKANNEIKDGLKAVQDHLDKLDIRLQEISNYYRLVKDIFNELIVYNFFFFIQVFNIGRVMVED